MNKHEIDPLAGPSTIQPGESDADYAYRHAYRYAYSSVRSGYGADRHSIARDYAEHVAAEFRLDPSNMGTWDHAVRFPGYLDTGV